MPPVRRTVASTMKLNTPVLIRLVANRVGFLVELPTGVDLTRQGTAVDDVLPLGWTTDWTTGGCQFAF
jgi:hypothetical protein